MPRAHRSRFQCITILGMPAPVVAHQLYFSAAIVWLSSYRSRSERGCGYSLAKQFDMITDRNRQWPEVRLASDIDGLRKF